MWSDAEVSLLEASGVSTSLGTAVTVNSDLSEGELVAVVERARLGWQPCITLHEKSIFFPFILSEHIHHPTVFVSIYLSLLVNPVNSHS